MIHHDKEPTPHTAKPPERCPYCRGRKLVRKGVRRKKLETVQRWACLSCGRLFTPGPSALRNKTYPLVVILDGLTWYDLGYPLLEVCARIKSRHGLAVVPSTVSAWLAEHRSLCAYRRLRAAGRKLFPARRILRSVKLYHQQVYSFVIHRAKLALLLEARANARFVGLARFLEEAPQLCPHELFRESARASQTKGSFDTTKAIVTTKENFATASAALVVPMVGDNHRRHETLQRFMLANNSVTVAVEVPIWITTAELTALAAEHGVTLPVEGGAITGHIAFLRLRNGAVHILDYKPDARTNRPIEQLRIYALALSRLAEIPLFDIKCAWFNENEYCEFSPRQVLGRRKRAATSSRVAHSKQGGAGEERHARRRSHPLRAGARKGWRAASTARRRAA